MQTHGPTTGGATTHGPTTGGSTMQTHGPTTGGATNMNTGGGGTTTHGPTTGGTMQTHGPTTGGATNMNTGGGGTTTHGPTTGGTMQTHGPTTGGATNMNTGGGGTTTHGPTTGGATTHGPTTGGTMQTHGPTTGGATNMNTGGGGTTTHGPTTGGSTHATDGGITHGSTGATHATDGGITHGSTGATHATDGGITHGTAGAHGDGVNVAGVHSVTTSHNISSAHNSSFGSHSNIGNGLAPKGSSTHVAKNGAALSKRPNGHISDVHDPKRGMDVHHGLNGNRAIHVERPDHSHVFGERGRPGYVQRGYNYHGHDFGRRSYFYHGHEYSRFYRGYGYRGLHFDVYAPGFYYHPAFYGWAYHPWGRPIYYGWGWGGAPWFGYYGGFFAPAPFYPSAALWLTDYMVAQDLQTAYAAHQEAGEAAPVPQDSGGPALTPEVKQEIAEEVNGQIALENQEQQQNAQNQDIDPGSSGIARMLSDGQKHVFVVGSALDVTDSNQNECALSDGDVLALTSPPPPDATAADLTVLASKGGNECGKTSTVTVQVTDLQEMQNHMRELIDQGLQELQSKQGQGGLPQAPPDAQAQPVPAQYAQVAPPADPNAGTEIQQQTQQADQAETDVNTEVAQGGTTQPQ